MTCTRKNVQVLIEFPGILLRTPALFKVTMAMNKGGGHACHTNHVADDRDIAATVLRNTEIIPLSLLNPSPINIPVQGVLFIVAIMLAQIAP